MLLISGKSSLSCGLRKNESGRARRALKKRFIYVLTGLPIPLLLLLVWEYAVRNSLLPPSLSAAPSQIIARLLELLTSGSIAKQASLSLLRLLGAVALGGLAGICAGMLLGQSRWADRLFSPMLQMLAPVPVVVWMPFVIMAVGSDELYKITLVTIATFFLLHIHTLQAVRAVERDHIELADIYEKTRWEKTRHVFLPAACPAIFTGLRLALAIGWIVVFFVEYGSSKEGTGGLGWFIADARAVGRVEDEYAGVLLLAIIGFLTDIIIVAIRSRWLTWADTAESTKGAEV